MNVWNPCICFASVSSATLNSGSDSLLTHSPFKETTGWPVSHPPRLKTERCIPETVNLAGRSNPDRNLGSNPRKLQCPPRDLEPVIKLHMTSYQDCWPTSNSTLPGFPSFLYNLKVLPRSPRTGLGHLSASCCCHTDNQTPSLFDHHCLSLLSGKQAAKLEPGTDQGLWLHV